MSLRARVLAGIVLIAVVLGVVMVVITTTMRANLIEQVDNQLASAARSGPDFGRAPPRDEFENGEPRRLSSLYVGYIDADGAADTVQTVQESNLSGEAKPLPVVRTAAAEQAARTGDAFTVDSRGSDVRYRVRAYVDPHSGNVTVLALPIDSVDDAVRGLIAVEAGGALVVAAVLGLVGWWVIHLGVRPVKRMTSVASAIAGGDLSHRVPDADPHTEAGELGAALNQMLGRIEAAFEERTRAEGKLRQFVADASHELRTPLATIRGYAELYRAGGLADDAELADAMRRTEQEAVRMGSLVDDLLHLARLDQGRPLASEPVDLAVLADDAARDARAVDPTRTVEAVTEGSLVIRGDESRLRQVIANVVGNALVHTPEGTPIEIRISRHNGKAVVAIADGGPGMAEDVAAHAFERFFRADPARSRHRGGSGLGLSIVDATVRAHGGVATLHTSPGEGTTVRIELPIDGAPR